MTEPIPIYHLALRDLLASAGGHFVTRHGWSLPHDFGDVAAEHATIRERAALVERSHFSRFMVTGTDAAVVLGRVFEGYIDELEEGRCMRTVVLDEDGRICDLVLIARTGGIAYLVVGEPGQRVETLARLQSACDADFDVEVGDRTTTTCLTGITGPYAAEIARQHLSDALPGRLPSMHCVAFQFHGFRALALRTSVTGEDGFELMLAPAVAQHIIETLGGAGIGLAGDAAQEIARVEACIPAFDPDLSPGLTPAEADLAGLVEARTDGAERLLSAVLIDAPTPFAPGTPLTILDSRVGEVRSCVHSPALAATIALGIIEAPFATPGQSLAVAGAKASVVAKPFLRRRSAQ